MTVVVDQLLQGPLKSKGRWPLALHARLCDLRPRFLPKGQLGGGYRAISRNGRVLLASDMPVGELAGQVARVRLQTWHRAILPGDVPEPYGVLLCIHSEAELCGGVVYDVALARDTAGGAELCLDVGAGLSLNFSRPIGPVRIPTNT